LSRRVKFILPDYDDIVDPGYDFEREEHSSSYKADRFRYGARLWDFYDPPPIDGVLVSISTMSSGKLRRVEESGGLRAFFRLPKGLELIGDCGAWQYRYEDRPPYTVEYVLDTYERLGVDYGVSLDHIPFFGNPVERMKLTLENATKSYEIWKKKGYSFTLMASVQGITIDDYLKSLDKLVKVGYRHLALGGLAKRDTGFIAKLVGAVRDKLKEYGGVEKIHVLGVARLSVIPILEELLDVSEDVSFDSTTFLRISWVRSVGNYVLHDMSAYTAIRVSDKGLIKLLRDYDRGLVSLEDVVDKLRAVAGDKLPYYIATLKDKPWKKCGCPICRTLGIDVVIFKGSDRNRRRGFHNVYVFRRLLDSGLVGRVKFRVERAHIPLTSLGNDNDMKREVARLLASSRRILVITNCTARKDVDMNEVALKLTKSGLRVPSFDLHMEDVYRRALAGFIKPAVRMYVGPVFKAVVELVKSLRANGKEVDFYIISGRYGLISENDPIIPYEAPLEGIVKSREKLESWMRERRVVEKLETITSNGNYDLVVIVLSKPYAKIIVDYLRRPHSIPLIAVIPESMDKDIRWGQKLVLPGSNITRRLKYVKVIKEAIKLNHKTLDQWIAITLIR
jgi:hypothetical protein